MACRELGIDIRTRQRWLKDAGEGGVNTDGRKDAVRKKPAGALSEESGNECPRSPTASSTRARLRRRGGDAHGQSGMGGVGIDVLPDNGREEPAAQQRYSGESEQAT